jgi:hypothetical protein
MLHDIIDNRSEKLLDTILTTLPGTERARFAVDYLFLSGLKPLREQLECLTEIRLLIGNTTDRETLETLAEDAGESRCRRTSSGLALLTGRQCAEGVPIRRLLSGCGEVTGRANPPASGRTLCERDGLCTLSDPEG